MFICAMFGPNCNHEVTIAKLKLIGNDTFLHYKFV